MENILTEYIAQLVLNEGRGNAKISEILQRLYPNQRGLSDRSVRRFLCENGISRRSGHNDDTLRLHDIGCYFARRGKQGKFSAPTAISYLTL